MSTARKSWFKCTILGEDFCFPGLYADADYVGFHAVRYVEALDREDAEYAVLDILREDEALSGVDYSEDGPQPLIFFEDILKLDAKPEGPPGAGLDFFPMDDPPE